MGLVGALPWVFWFVFSSPSSHMPFPWYVFDYFKYFTNGQRWFVVWDIILVAFIFRFILLHYHKQQEDEENPIISNDEPSGPQYTIVQPPIYQTNQPAYYQPNPPGYYQTTTQPAYYQTTTQQPVYYQQSYQNNYPLPPHYYTTPGSQQ